MDYELRHSVCPHDCPSTCALEVERIDNRTIGRVRGAPGNSYTSGVICAKVARYSERVHHPERLMHPLIRVGEKGEGKFAQISWNEALDRVAQSFIDKVDEYGSETVWPYFFCWHHGNYSERRDPETTSCNGLFPPSRKHMHRTCSEWLDRGCWWPDGT